MQWSHTLFNDERKNVHNGNKLRTYRKFKYDFKSEEYLVNFKNRKNRFIFSRLRCSAHRLLIETGRYSRPKIPVEERICTKCDLKQVEDEYHLIRICKLYERIRTDLDINISEIEETYVHMSDSQKFVYLMSADAKICNILEMFIQKLYDVRDDI